MLHYRLYYFDGSGRIVNARSLTAEDDQAALALLAGDVHEGRLELWEGARLVARQDGDGGETAPSLRPPAPDR
jgi:hypothetical protein